MPKRLDHPPDLVPRLSRGKHRSPRKGACFMEMASYLAGERWSDRPRCTHPLLAGLARSVNDHMSDPNRSELVAMIPSVIGLTTDDPRADARIAWRCALAALPVASASRQNTLAVAVLVTDRVLGDLDGRPLDDLLPESRAALESAPLAASRSAAQYAGDRPRAGQPLPPDEHAEHRARRGAGHLRGVRPSTRTATCASSSPWRSPTCRPSARPPAAPRRRATRPRPGSGSGRRHGLRTPGWRSPSCEATSSSRTSMPWSTPPTAG